jgi:hypothetical protein
MAFPGSVRLNEGPERRQQAMPRSTGTEPQKQHLNEENKAVPCVIGLTERGAISPAFRCGFPLIADFSLPIAVAPGQLSTGATAHL